LTAPASLPASHPRTSCHTSCTLLARLVQASNLAQPSRKPRLATPLPPGSAGLLAGLAARAGRPEYAQLLADCQRLYCEVRLGLVAGVTAQRVAAYAREPLPQRTRSGCAYLMQARPRPQAGAEPGARVR